MGVKSCQILLERTNEGVYRPGQTVAGTLKYVIDKPTKIGSIDIYLTGKGKCRWTESDGDDTTTYTNEEEYVKMYRNLYIARDEDNTLAGNYEHPFEFILPDDLPTSIKNTTCTIEYKVVVKFVKNNLFETKQKFEAEVPIYGYVSPCSPEPLIFGLQKNLLSLSSNEKIINLKAEIERTFLTPGENIKLKVTVDNDTDVPITIQTELMKYFTYIAKGEKQKRIEKETVKNTTDVSPILKEKNVSHLACVIPTLPSLYSIQHSKVMIAEFKVKVTAKVPFPHINAEVEVPVVIGERRERLGAAAVGCDLPPSYSEALKEDDMKMSEQKRGELSNDVEQFEEFV